MLSGTPRLPSYLAAWKNAFRPKHLCWRDIITSPTAFTGRNFSCRQNVAVAKNRTIRTLDPTSLKSTDFLDLTGRMRPILKLEKAGKVRMVCGVLYDSRQIARFPNWTRGFLYYSPRPPLPPGYGEIRFRLTQSSDPASFDHGTDLLNCFGRPWSMKQTNAKIRRLLVEDGLVAPSEPVPAWNTISSLRIDQLKPTDFFQFAGGPQTWLFTQYGRVRLQARGSQIRASPENSKGFLYYYDPPNLPPGCGEVRLRITGDPDPSLFHQGSDLLLPDGSPWRQTLPGISHYPPLKQLLVEEGLVAPSLFSMIEDARPGLRRLVLAGVNLFKIDQPLTMDLSHTRYLYINSGSSNVVKTYLTYDSRIKAFPYTGKVVGQFELCTSSTGKQHLQFRVLEVIESVKCVVPNYDGHLHIPTVGKLLSLGLRGKIQIRKISLSADTSVARRLRLLLPDLDNVTNQSSP